MDLCANGPSFVEPSAFLRETHPQSNFHLLHFCNVPLCSHSLYVPRFESLLLQFQAFCVANHVLFCFRWIHIGVSMIVVFSPCSSSCPRFNVAINIFRSFVVNFRHDGMFGFSGLQVILRELKPRQRIFFGFCILRWKR